MGNVAVGIVEDEPIVRESLVTFFDDQHNLEVVCQVNSLEAFEQMYSDGSNSAPDVLLLDIGLPGMSGLEGIRVIKKITPDTDVIMLTTYEESETIFKALCAGACSYLSKRSSLSQILEAITVVSQGGSYMSPSIARKVVKYFSPSDHSKKELLTPRQQQIVSGLVEGLSYKMIADKYIISIETVRDHIKKIYKKLQINSKAELIRLSVDGDL
ncbi:MAG: response regulator transcription factor [Saprospiraceae bacterium]|nr:response regulator transcription factor [Saprospiraceae bacterium]